MELHLSGGWGVLLGADLGGVAWLLTYSLHAALWAATVALLVRWPLPSALRHTSWKAALFGPFVTTLLALVPRSVDSARGLLHRVPELAVVSLRPTQANTSMHGYLGSVALAVLLFGLARYCLALLKLARSLGRKRPVYDARLLECLERMRTRFALPAIRLSQCAAIDCPLVLGVAEICIPQATLARLGEREIEAVFAHELAHLERHDGIWFPLVGLLNAALWLHPITRWVCARFRQSAERACDDRCVQLTGKPRALARALASIAARVLVADQVLVFPPMAHPRSSLVARVAYLTSTGAQVERASSARSRAGLVIGMASLTAVSVTSSVRVAAASHVALPAPEAIAQTTADLSRQMNALARREQLLEAELQRLSSRSTASQAAPNDSVHLREVEQELGHVREMQVWLETSPVNR